MKKMIAAIMVVSVAGLLILNLLGCGQSATTTTPGTATTGLNLLNDAKNTAPEFVPSSRVGAAAVGAFATWETGNAMYEIFYALREFAPVTDEGKVDRKNLYKLLYDVETLFDGINNQAVLLSAPKIIVPPFNFGGNVTYEAAANNMTSEASIALATTETTVKAIITWTWRDASLPKKMEVGILEMQMNRSTRDITVDFIFSVDYNTDDTVCEYNNRTKISGNASTHAFEFNQAIGGSAEVLSQIIGKGVSKGAGNKFLLKMKNSGDSNFSSPRFLVISAEATEDDLKTMNITAESYTDPALLPAEVSAYKDYVVNTLFYAFTDILSDRAELNKGNPKEGTIYLNY